MTFFILLFSCTKPQTILICGDHKCVNKAEAEQYFEDNLTLEVRVVDKKENKVEPPLEESSEQSLIANIIKTKYKDQSITIENEINNSFFVVRLVNLS